ncbi:Pre-mRNA-splicing factor of RES complex-domain-containing protein [Lipomyces kononenkoae]|uniref:Pre-mRNA-splicing factor of RES complex-domain-containing protein n=1 Tax=Lipomyces kononenkoae TaxID=34357 RepID=A0ACC3T0E7_LIPKO
MSRLDYLAAKYLTAEQPADSKHHKKRKRKVKDTTNSIKSGKPSKHQHVTTEDGLILADDDAEMWGVSGKRYDKDEDEEIEGGEDAPVTVEIANSRHKVSAGWRKIGQLSSKDADDIVVEEEEQETSATNSNTEDLSTARPERVGGLKTAAQVKAALDRKLAAELEKMEKSGTSGKNAEVVYRDASGRRIDINAYKVKMQQQLLDEEKKKAEAKEKEKELNKGLVQELQRKEEDRKLSEAGGLSLNRYSHDRELNDELKLQELWDDPAARFLSKKKKETVSATGLKVYQGAFPPNRFNIPPGHRWDGVDRSNGFEEKLLQKRRNEKEKKLEEDVYASDDDE